MIPALLDPSPDMLIAKRLVDAFGQEGAHRAWDEISSHFTNVELAALAAHPPMWLRPKQCPPPGEWRSWGNLAARGWGKTDAMCRFIVDEVQAGRVRNIGMCAQNELKTIAVQVQGLIAASPPWFKPEWRGSVLELHWPNGAVAHAFTPEVPDNIRSENLDLAWMSEVQSWSAASREETYSNFLFATRINKARTIWDATPKKGHPILKKLMARAARYPNRHYVVSGSTYENPHLAKSVIEDMEREYGGTQKGKEELEGIMPDDADKSLWKTAWFLKAGFRTDAPARFIRKSLAVDPAVTSRKGSDTTGINGAGLGADGRAYVIEDASGKHEVAAWAELVLDLYVDGGYGLVLAETNKGGDLVVQNIRAAAKDRGLTVVVIGKADRAPPPLKGTVFIREVHARGAKEERAEPVATAYQKGRVSHVVGANLATLEETMTTWEPEGQSDSPGDMDALVHNVAEILGLTANTVDKSAGFKGIEQANKGLAGHFRGGLPVGGGGDMGGI